MYKGFVESCGNFIYQTIEEETGKENWAKVKEEYMENESNHHLVLMHCS